jgi:hypothetical protein
LSRNQYFSNSLTVKKKDPVSEEICEDLQRNVNEAPKVNAFSKNEKTQTLQIRTISDGYNSGRTYYLRVTATDAQIDIVAILNQMSKFARKRANVKNRLDRAQTRVRKIHDSMWFQTASALLILTVSVSPF